MVNFSIIVNDTLYRKETVSSITFSSVLGESELLNQHSDIFSIIQPGIITARISNKKELHFLVFDGLMSFLNGNEATLLTNHKIYDVNNLSSEEKSNINKELNDRKIPNLSDIMKKIERKKLKHLVNK